MARYLASMLVCCTLVPSVGVDRHHIVLADYGISSTSVEILQKGWMRISELGPPVSDVTTTNVSLRANS